MSENTQTATTEAPQEEAVVEYNPDVVQDVVRSLVRETLGAMRETGEAPATPEINPNASSVEARVVSDENASEDGLARNLFTFWKGQVARNMDMVHRGLTGMVQGGHYGQKALEAYQRGAGDFYQTLVDADGAYLLPTVVVNQIEEIADVYGVSSQVGTTIPHVVGTLRIPAGSGKITFSAVAEGTQIASSIRAFSAVELNPKKWATIVPITFEANLEAGPRIIQDMLRSAGRGVAEARDDAMFNGDGSSSYHSISGILDRAGTGTQTLGSGSTAPEDIDPDDLINVWNEVPASIRRNGVYVFHPDMEAVFLTKKDDDNRYLFDYRMANGVPTLKGKRVYYTEVLQGLGAAADTPFGVFGDFSYWKTALGQGLTSEELREGTVQDADTGTEVSLASYDMRAIKMRTLFDMDTNFESAFALFVTAAS